MQNEFSKPLDLSKVTENEGVMAKPLILDSTIYLGACDSYFYALDAKTGFEL